LGFGPPGKRIRGFCPGQRGTRLDTVGRCLFHECSLRWVHSDASYVDLSRPQSEIEKIELGSSVVESGGVPLAHHEHKHRPPGTTARSGLGAGANQHLSETNARRTAEALDQLLAADGL